MKKNQINMFIAMMLGNSLLIQADMNLEENMYAPARDMVAMDEAMNRTIEERRALNRANPIVFKDDKSFHEAPMPEFVEKGNQYILEQTIEDSDKTKIEVALVGNMLSIKSTTTTKDTLSTGTSSSSSSYVSIDSQSLSIPADADGKGMVYEYKNGLLKVTLPKKNNQFKK